MPVVVLTVALLVILTGAELFTNGIEWFGRRLNLAEGAVGSVLAAVGTALPETMIPVIAIAFPNSEESTEIGVGAILGAPFMLATLAMFVTGMVVLIFRRRRPGGEAMAVDVQTLTRDVRYFAVAYAIAIGAAFLPVDALWLKWLVGVVLLGIYGWYVKGHFEADPDVDLEDLLPLRFHRLDRHAHRRDPSVPRLRIVGFQVLAALACIVVGAAFFVQSVTDVATHIGVNGVLVALVLAPIATELPEGFNSVLWVRQGKDTLAMGNITGAMVFQSTIVTFVGVVLASTTWHISGDSSLAFASAAIAFVASATIFVPMARRGSLRGRHLLVGGLFYLGYLSLVIVGAGRPGV